MPKHSKCQCFYSFVFDTYTINSNRLLQHFEIGLTNTKMIHTERTLPHVENVYNLLFTGGCAATLQCILRAVFCNVLLHVIIFPSALQCVLSHFCALHCLLSIYENECECKAAGKISNTK